MVLESPIPFAFFEIFAENVHAAIDVSIDKASVRRAVQASLDTLSAELWDILIPEFGKEIHVKAGCLAKMIIVVIRQIFTSIEEMLTDRIQADIVHSCRMITHHFKDFQVLKIIVNMYLCR